VTSGNVQGFVIKKGAACPHPRLQAALNLNKKVYIILRGRRFGNKGKN
jgi:hypothetical protein